MALIPKEVVKRVQNYADMDYLIEKYGLKVDDETLDRVMVRCPFHNDKTASMSFSLSKKLFYCFGCKKGGNVFHFIMLKEKVAFPDAVRIAGKDQGIAVL